MLSDIDIVQLEADLEKDLATRVNQHEDAQPSLELNSLRESIQQDDNDSQLQSFSLLASVRASIHSIRQETSGIIQSINDELFESRNDATHNQVTISEVDDKDEVQWPTEEDTIFSLTQIPSSTTNDDIVDHSESDPSTNCERYDCDFDAATNDCCETDAAAEYHDQYLDQTSSVADESFEQAMTEANDQVRLIEEKHRMKRLILEQRKEHVRRNRNAKRLQRWLKRIYSRRRILLSSIISSLTSNTVQSAVEFGISQCTKVLESTIDCSNRLVLRSSRDLSIPQTRQMMNWNDLNCRYIMVIRDPSKYTKVHVIILYQRNLKHFVVHLTRRLTDEVANHSSDTLLLRYSDDSETRFSLFAKQALPIHSLGVQPLLLPNLLSPPLMIENGPPVLDLTDKSSLCLVLCQMTLRVMTRRALRALQCLKAAVQIQSIYRGFVVRRRLDSVQCTAFDYIDSEIDDILGDNSNDMLQFDEEDEADSKWSPCRPYIEPKVHCSFDETDMISTGEADTTIPKPKSEPLHRVLSSTSRAQYHDNESEDTTSRRKAKIVRRDHLKEKKQESNTLTWQNMKVKDIRVAQAMIKKKSLMRRKGANGRSMKARR